MHEIQLREAKATLSAAVLSFEERRVGVQALDPFDAFLDWERR